MEEQFKDYLELYSVSNLGRVYSKRRKRFLTIGEDRLGYKRVTLFINGKEKKENIHRLVAKLFIPPVEGKEEVNHIDGDKSNNRVDNLEWCNRSENVKHSYRELGHLVGMERKVYVVTVNGEEEYESLVECCSHYNISIGTPHALFTGITQSSPKMFKLGIVKIGYDKNNMYNTRRN